MYADAIDAVVYREYAPDAGNALVVLSSGQIVKLGFCAEEIDDDLRAAGMIPAESGENSGALVPLTPEQRNELSALYRVGYDYIAKDKDGRAYAFNGLPVKQGAYWNSREGGQNCRLTEDYDFLDFEDASPTSIPALLGVDMTRETEA